MKRSSSKKYIIPFIVFLVLIAINIFVFSFFLKDVRDKTAANFENDTAQIQEIIAKRMSLYTDTLYGFQGLFAASKSVEYDEWSAYVNSLDFANNYSGISAALFIQRTPAAATSSLPFTIYPFSVKSEYYPFTYVSPATDDRKKVLGFDVSSDPKRLNAIQRASGSGKPSATEVVLSAATNEPSFSIYVPIYENSASTSLSSSTMPASKLPILGFAGIAFNVKNLFTGVLKDPAYAENIDLQIYDTDSASNTLIYELASGTSIDISSKSLTKKVNITVGGRTWLMSFKSLPGYSISFTENLVPYSVLTAGILLSLLIMWVLFLYASSQERAETIAEKLKSDYEESQKLFRLSIDNAADMFFIFDGTGKVVEANTQAASLLGYTRQEILSKNFSDLATEDVAVEYEKRFKDTPTGMPVRVDSVIRRKDGSIFPTQVAVTYFNDDEQKLMIALVRDVTSENEAKQKLMEKTVDLERLNGLMIDRELKMVELKKKTEGLK